MRSPLLLVALLLLSACSTAHPRRDPTGESLPTVRGADLNEKPVTLPDAVAGRPALLLVGFRQSSQFDIDRWLLGLHQAGIDVNTLEVPTIPGLVPGLYARQIDQGMRSGIPQDLYDIVVTLYRDDAKSLARFTGNTNPLPARVLLLDPAGRVAFFHDTGYSIPALTKLQSTLDQLR